MNITKLEKILKSNSKDIARFKIGKVNLKVRFNQYIIPFKYSPITAAILSDSRSPYISSLTYDDPIHSITINFTKFDSICDLLIRLVYSKPFDIINYSYFNKYLTEIIYIIDKYMIMIRIKHKIDYNIYDLQSIMERLIDTIKYNFILDTDLISFDIYLYKRITTLDIRNEFAILHSRFDTVYSFSKVE